MLPKKKRSYQARIKDRHKNKKYDTIYLLTRRRKGMGDVFKEQLVARQASNQDKLKVIAIWVGAIVVGLITIFVVGTLIGSIALVAAIYGAMYYSSQFKKEHEYALTNNELDIDVIYNKQRRKELVSCDIKKIDVMASIKDEQHKGAFERAQKVIDASDGHETADTYAILAPIKGELTKILLTPNEDMLNLIYKQAPHKVMKYRG